MIQPIAFTSANAEIRGSIKSSVGAHVLKRRTGMRQASRQAGSTLRSISLAFYLSLRGKSSGLSWLHMPPVRMMPKAKSEVTAGV